MWGLLDTTLCDKVCRWFSPGIPVSFANKTDRHDITEILLKVALKTITPPQFKPHVMLMVSDCSFFKLYRIPMAEIRKRK
jgi:hypothetical protein